MLGKVRPLTHYRVTVLNVKARKGTWGVPDSDLFFSEEDVAFGYGYKNHREGKYFDLWFTRYRDEDPENFITLGRIVRIEGNTFITKLGKFIIEPLEESWTGLLTRVLHVNALERAISRTTRMH